MHFSYSRILARHFCHTFLFSQILAGHFCQALLPHISQVLRFFPSNIDSCRALLPRISHSQILARHFCRTFFIFLDSCRALLPSTFAMHFSYYQILAGILPGTFAKHFCHAFFIFSDSCQNLAGHFCQTLLPSTLPGNSF